MIFYIFMHKITLAIRMEMMYIEMQKEFHEKFFLFQKHLEDIVMKEKVILAYSGGLDTTAIIPWLKENFDYDVVCVCIDCGQGEELDGLEERAKSCGASKLYIEDVIDEFCDEYIVPCVQAHAVYENKYLFLNIV